MHYRITGAPHIAHFESVTKLTLCGSQWESSVTISAPEGRTSLARRFSGGKSGKNDPSPGGTTEFRNRLTLRCVGFAAPAPPCPSHRLPQGFRPSSPPPQTHSSHRTDCS